MSNSDSEGEKQQEDELSWETVQKREEEMRKDWSALQKLKKEKRGAERSRREAQTTAEDAEERASDDELRSDEEEDTKPRQTKWSAECASTLPNFNMVRESSRTVEEWCKSTKAVLAEYWGPVGLIRQAVMDNVKLPEFKRPCFDPCAFSIDELLEFIQEIWRRRYARATLEIVIVKEPSESWCDLHLLIIYDLTNLEFEHVSGYKDVKFLLHPVFHNDVICYFTIHHRTDDNHFLP